MTERQVEDAEKWAEICLCLFRAIDIAENMPEGRRALSEALCGALETVATGGPHGEYLGGLRRDAEWWADLAPPAEIEAYTGAGLRRIERATFAQNARKRIFVMLWKNFSDAERKRFLTMVGNG